MVVYTYTVRTNNPRKDTYQQKFPARRSAILYTPMRSNAHLYKPYYSRVTPRFYLFMTLMLARLLA
jgi:hypothetical protein